MRRSEAAALTWADVGLRENESELLQVRRSKTDPEDEGLVLYIGKEAGEALRAIRPAEELVDRNTPVFGLSVRQIGRRVKTAAEAAGLGEGFIGHGGRAVWPRTWLKAALRFRVDESRPVDELQDAGALRRATGGEPGRGGLLLQGVWVLEITSDKLSPTIASTAQLFRALVLCERVPAHFTRPVSTTTTRLRWRLHPAFTAGGAASLVGAARPLVA